MTIGTDRSGMAAPGTRAQRLRIGVSACLLGEPVRFDGAHRHDRWVTDVLGRHVDLVPVCPEVEIGLGTPREPIRLERVGGRIRLVAPGSGADHTERMQSWAARRLAQLDRQALCGYILKKDSPSCGMERVRIHGRGGTPARTGRGMFAAALMQRFPALPVEEEAALQDRRRRENFVTRIYSRSRWLAMETAGLGRARLRRFHERHACVLLARSPVGTHRLGRLLAPGSPRRSAAALAQEYAAGCSAILQRIPTRKSHTSVLRQLAGRVRQAIDAGDRAELEQAIQDYQRGRLPLVVPVTLLRHHGRRLQVSYLLDQVYLNPHPDEQMLLDRV
jgi:uncharacterized protein YbbK (DUF523 family)/uncharacterized protein YbgA (DUF1722 family)